MYDNDGPVTVYPRQTMIYRHASLRDAIALLDQYALPTAKNTVKRMILASVRNGIYTESNAYCSFSVIPVRPGLRRGISFRVRVSLHRMTVPY